MSGRPYARSTRTACAFMATSWVPDSRPKKNSPMTSAGREAATPSGTSSSAKSTAAGRGTPPLPKRSTSRPQTSMTTTKPTGMASSAAPSVPSLSSSRCLIAGIRATQTAPTMPSRKKYVSTATRARRVSVMRPSYADDPDARLDEGGGARRRHAGVGHQDVDLVHPADPGEGTGADLGAVPGQLVEIPPDDGGGDREPFGRLL